MSTVTYKHQPGIHKTRGKVPLAGTAHLYKVSKRLWYDEIEEYLRGVLIGRTLHVCSGLSTLGDVRLDLYANGVDIRADAARLPIRDRAFDSVLCDPPYNGRFQWNHDVLNELHRVADRRIVFQHWFVPANKDGLYKKLFAFRLSEVSAAVDPVEDDDSGAFRLSDLTAWNPRAYFGRTQMISVFDRIE